MRDLHAAQPDVIARPEAVHVEARAGAHIGAATRRQSLGEGEILRGGQLDVRFLAGDSRDREIRRARPGRNRPSPRPRQIGDGHPESCRSETPAASAPAQISRGTVVETGRRLAPQRVGDRQQWRHRIGVIQRIRHPRDQIRRHEGPGAIVDQHRSGGRGQRFKPRRTDSCRVASADTGAG